MQRCEFELSMKIQLTILFLTLLGPVTDCAANGSPKLDSIQNVVVIMAENWSFDSLFGKFPGAENLETQAAISAAPQIDASGQPLLVLPPVLDIREGRREGLHDFRFPTDLPPKPFDLERYVGFDEESGDLIHRFFQEQEQINGGKMDRFVQVSDNGALAMSFFDARKTALGRLANEFVLCDHFFHSAFGGSFLNHFFFVSAKIPIWKDAPEHLTIKLNKDGKLIRDGVVTQDGYAVNTVLPRNSGFQLVGDPEDLLPQQTYLTIGDRLSAKGVSWSWYAGGFPSAIGESSSKDFRLHQQPFLYFKSFGPGSENRKRHLFTEDKFFTDIRDGGLPAVSFIKPSGKDSGHPREATFEELQTYISRIVDVVKGSKYWPGAVIIIFFDENGGRWDHVAPPKGSRWGPGTRVPAIVVSPLAKKKYVDRNLYESLSIIKLIENRWGLSPLSEHDAGATEFSGWLEGHLESRIK